ncbi:MAG: YihA family ribosome biogenesis GTP-binding protein, partial [Polaromonas sp.]
GGDVKLFSALKRQGVEEVAQHLWDWAHPKEKPVKAPTVQSDVEPSAEVPDPQTPEQS